MREIKFRGKRLDTRAWLYGDLMHDNCVGAYVYPLDAVNLSSENQVDVSTVGQFTGLYDKGGKEIYEGDIVECVSWNEYWSDCTNKTINAMRRKMYVDYRNGSFKMIEPMPSPIKDNVWDIICNGDVTIIGNVYENADLLKGGLNDYE